MDSSNSIIGLWFFWMIYCARRQRSHLKEVGELNRIIMLINNEIISVNKEMRMKLKEIHIALKDRNS
jgi:hypothetical protein